MFYRVFWTAILAGACAGLFLFAAHMAKTTPLILHAEIYENAAAGSASQGSAHDQTKSSKADLPSKATAPAPAPEGWAPGDGLERSAYTLLSDLLSSIGFAFLLVGAISLYGKSVTWKQGTLWGLCGYVAIFAAPSFGLPPELPGMQAADLVARQVWWGGTAVATAGGLALIFLVDRRALKALGAVFLILPHVIGAPVHAIESGNVPAELAAQFAVTTLVISGLFWLLLGGLTGHFYNRFAKI